MKLLMKNSGASLGAAKAPSSEKNSWVLGLVPTIGTYKKMPQLYFTFKRCPPGFSKFVNNYIYFSYLQDSGFRDIRYLSGAFAHQHVLSLFHNQPTSDGYFNFFYTIKQGITSHYQYGTSQYLQW